MSSLTRPVRIHLAMKDGPLPKSIKQVLPIVGNESSHTYVETIDEADLVIFNEVRDIERNFSKEKSCAYLNMPGMRKPTLPENCMTIDPLKILVGLIEAINATKKKLTPIVESPVTPVEESVPIRPDALGILVIDDTPKNIVSAKSGLAGHRLTTVTGYEEAMTILEARRFDFDVVLTDLHLPMSSKTMGDKFKLGELVPYGVLLMLEAARQFVKYVGVVTDLSHHDDPFSAAFDHFSHFPIKVEGAKVLMMHARLDRNGAKDWAEALGRLMAE